MGQETGMKPENLNSVEQIGITYSIYYYFTIIVYIERVCQNYKEQNWKSETGEEDEEEEQN